MDKLHHANVILNERDPKDFVSKSLLENLGFEINGSPDFLFVQKESFGIDDAREFERWAIKKPLSGNFKASLVSALSITFEAQNALLKILEEPKEGTYIFISLDGAGGLLPTFLSRVRIFNNGQKADNHIASKFLSPATAERLSMIQKISKGDKKGEMKNLIKDLEMAAYKEDVEKTKIKKILLAKTYLSARGSSPKMLLDWLSCVL